MRSVLGLVLLGWLAVPASAQDSPGRAGDDDGEVVERAELTVGPGRQPIRSVVVDNALGDVRIEGHDGDFVSIISVKHAPDADTLERLRVTLVPDPDGTVRLATTLVDDRERRPVALAKLRIDLVIRVPRAAKIDGRVGHGHLEVRNVDAGAELDAGAGSIAVANVAGVVHARSLDGDQRFDEVFGTLDAHAVDGDVAFDTVRGAALTAQVYDGNIDGQHVATRELHLHSIHGDISVEADAEPGALIVVSSLRGKVDVKLHSATRLAVRARAGGQLRWAGPAATPGRWVDGQFGTVGHPGRNGSVRVESRYGDVAFSLIE